MAEQQVAIHFSSDKYLTDHTEAGKKSCIFSFVKQRALHARTLAAGKRKGFCLKNDQVLLYLGSNDWLQLPFAGEAKLVNK